MKAILITFFIFVGTVIFFLASLKDGSLVQYLDTHPNPKLVPAVEFYIGTGYSLLDSLQESATFYQRIAERYPKSPYADDAYFNYLQALDDMNTSRQEMIDLYTLYLERFPKGDHIEVAQKRIEYYHNRTAH